MELINSEGTKKRPLKHCITDQQMTKLADAMDEDVVPAGQNVIVQGDEGHTFFVIADGDVDVYVDNSKVNTFGRGRYFGEVALIRDDKRNATITAGRTGAKVLAVDREDFVALLGDIDALISSQDRRRRWRSTSPKETLPRSASKI